MTFSVLDAFGTYHFSTVFGTTSVHKMSISEHDAAGTLEGVFGTDNKRYNGHFGTKTSWFSALK